MPGEQRSGHHRAKSLDREHPINGQPRWPFGWTTSRRQCEPRERPAKFGNALTRAGRYDDDRRLVEKRPGDHLLYLLPNDIDHVVVGQVRLGQNYEAGRDVQEAADLEVLTR